MPDATGALVRAIGNAGGLVGRSDLARLWSVSRQRVAQLVALEGFPAPVAIVNGGEVWALDAVEKWRSSRRGPGRPANAGHGGDPS